MKKVILISLLFLAMLGAILYAVLNPSGRFGRHSQPPSERPSEVIFPTSASSVQSSSAASVEQAIKDEFYRDPEGAGFSISRIVVVEGFALSDWMDENSGGVALYEERQPGSWTLRATEGGVWAVEDLVTLGVPPSTARTLLQELTAP